MRETLLLLDELLRRRFSTPLRELEDPLDVLIRTILSQNTSDKNSHRAFANLKARFPSWDLLLNAPEEEIKAEIRCGGLSRIKARRIKEVLRTIKEDRGSLSLDFLGELPLKEARDYLLSLPGVGDKTASCVLLFSFAKPVFPVDTHIQRISERLGLWGDRLTPKRIEEIVEAALPSERFLSLHLNLIRLGREICHAHNPLCPNCPLKELCRYNALRFPSENR